MHKRAPQVNMVKLQVAGLAAIFELEMGLELGFETDLDCKTTLGGGGGEGLWEGWLSSPLIGGWLCLICISACWQTASHGVLFT